MRLRLERPSAMKALPEGAIGALWPPGAKPRNRSTEPNSTAVQDHCLPASKS